MFNSIPVAVNFTRYEYMPFVKVTLVSPNSSKEPIMMILDHIIQVSYKNNGSHVEGDEWKIDNEFYPKLLPYQKIAANIMFKFTNMQEVNNFIKELTYQLN